MDKLTRRSLIAAAALGAGATATAAVIGRSSGPEPPEISAQMIAEYRDGDLPVDDPESREWLGVQGIYAAMRPQQIAPPGLAEASVDRLEVRALNNGQELAFHLKWQDADVDELDGLAMFHDACAVALPWNGPNGGPPPITMGSPGAPVHIMQWRASWQRDIEQGRTGPQAIYPNLVRDITPDELMDDAAAVPYEPGRAVDNPLSRFLTAQPIEEIVAEGFGSTTALPSWQARGRGVHADGSWTLTVAVPFERGNGAAPITAGTVWPVSFALWLGSKGNRGGRKHFADWVSCEIQSA
jgi:hypothetical protein